MNMKPRVENNHCLRECAYFATNEDELMSVTCLRENVVLEYYDGYLAECTAVLPRTETDLLTKE